MNASFMEGREKVSSPTEELALLRGAAAERHLAAEKAGENINEHQAVRETLEHYAATSHEAVLHPDYAISAHEANEIVLELQPEEHDEQIEHLIALVEDKGLKNAMQIVAKMNDPHLYDDFHRFLVQFVASGYPIQGLKENDELWRSLHMTLFEVILPETSQADKDRSLKELISGMEQFYAGMLSVPDQDNDKSWFTIEIANSVGSDQFIFYIAVPSTRRNLLEKQVLAVFPGATVSEHKDDYNIFREGGTTLAAAASLDKHFLYPLRTYETFDTDPLASLLNAFSKIDRAGEGAAIQIVVGGRRDGAASAGRKALDKLRKGEKLSQVLKEVDHPTSTAVTKEFMSLFRSEEKAAKEKEAKAERAAALDETTVEQFTRKLKSPFVAVNIRVVASAATAPEAENILQDLESGFNQFENGHGNSLVWQKLSGGRLTEFLDHFSLRTFEANSSITLSLEELTTCLHLPAADLNRAAPQLKQAKSGTAPAPLDLPSSGTLLGRNRHRGAEKTVYITPEDRLRHFYVIGQTGTGKTTLLKNMIMQDIRSGAGVCFIDPHGSDVMDILSAIPKERYEDVIYFDPAATDRPMALNMLEFDHRFPEQKTFVVNEMFSIFQKLYGAVPESMGPMFEQYFRNATMLVIEDPESGSTLLDVSRVMSNKAFREYKLAHCRNPVVVQFWKEIAEKAGGEASLANIVPYITSKFDVFLSNEIMRPIVTQEKSSFNMREVMDGRKILLVNLSKGRLGDINSHLLGLILVGKVLMAALSRVDALGQPLSDFYLYLDEFQNVTTDSIATILSEARKYRLALTVAHQFVGQLDEKIKNAVFGNVGSMAIFRVGAEDAEVFEQQLSPNISRTDIVNLDNFNAYVRLLVSGRPAKPFNIVIEPPVKGSMEIAAKLRELSALTYGRDRNLVEQEILAKYQNLK